LMMRIDEMHAYHTSKLPWKHIYTHSWSRWSTPRWLIKNPRPPRGGDALFLRWLNIEVGAANNPLTRKVFLIWLSWESQYLCG
jgi:hypothetical protein